MAKTTKPKRPAVPFALVEWADPHSPDATDVVSIGDVGTIHSSISMLTAGWVLRHDSGGITLAAEWCGGGDFRGVTFVPSTSITAISWVTLTTKRVRPTTGTNPQAFHDHSQLPA